ncbi:MAG: glycosyltransferase family 2 protein [Mycobacteriales bacterium]
MGVARVVLIPAHNEGGLIAATLRSVFAQCDERDRVIVVADNCTDDTVAVALRAGAEVVETAGNAHKKAGALNQVLDVLLETCPDEQPILVMDADTTLQPGFLSTATGVMASQAASAVGGIFFGQSGGGLLGLFQRNEYLRYSRQVQSSGRVWVLTGTGTVFRAGALRDVLQARRDGRLPGAPAVYDTLALTEDNELTLALKTLGHRCLSPVGCRVETEVMPTWGRLWQQRLRWQRGALENLRSYGWTSTTRPYVRQQLMMALGVVMLWLYLAMTALALGAGQRLQLSPLWAVVTAVFVAERVLTVRRGGWRSMAVAAPLFIELFYDVFVQLVFVKASVDALRRAEAHWGRT